MPKNYYEILGIRENANDEQIANAYRKLAITYHPFRQDQLSEKPLAWKQYYFSEICEAYDVLSQADH